MSRQGITLVISAPSGAGKSTLVSMLLSEFPALSYSISCTTRKPRAGEIDGREYHFLSPEDFIARREAGEFVEWAEVHGNFYGTLLKPVREMLASGKDVLFDMDVAGAATIKSSLPGARFVFILPPSIKELERRLVMRGLDDEESIKRRLANARAEIREAMWYDALVVNNRLETAYAALRGFYLAAILAPSCHRELVDALLRETP